MSVRLINEPVTIISCSSGAGAVAAVCPIATALIRAVPKPAAAIPHLRRDDFSEEKPGPPGFLPVDRCIMIIPSIVYFDVLRAGISTHQIVRGGGLTVPEPNGIAFMKTSRDTRPMR